MKHNGKVSWHDPVIRLTGLPFNCTMADVQKFFESMFFERKKNRRRIIKHQFRR